MRALRQDLQRDAGDGAVPGAQGDRRGVRVVTLLAHGCPPQAIVAAFGWDERTVAR